MVSSKGRRGDNAEEASSRRQWCLKQPQRLGRDAGFPSEEVLFKFKRMWWPQTFSWLMAWVTGMAAHDSDREACSDLFIQADLDRKKERAEKEKSDAHIWEAMTGLVFCCLHALHFFHLSNRARLLYSSMLQHSQFHMLETNFSCFFYLSFKILLKCNLFHEELPDFPGNSVLPSVFAMVPCIDLHSLNKY